MIPLKAAQQVMIMKIPANNFPSCSLFPLAILLALFLIPWSVTCFTSISNVAPVTSTTPATPGSSTPSVTSYIFSSQIRTRESNDKAINCKHKRSMLWNWVQINGEWQWQDDDGSTTTLIDVANDSLELSGGSGEIKAQATPTLPAGKFRPKQSLGQNYLRDGNTVAKIVRAFVQDVKETSIVEHDGGKLFQVVHAVELGPGAGALTDLLLPTLFNVNGISEITSSGSDPNNLKFASFQLIEIDPRSVELLTEKYQHSYPNLIIRHEDVLQVDYPSLALELSQQLGTTGEGDESREGGAIQPLSIVGNLPYYITSQILFALADASHVGAVRSATVTMQWEVGQRIVAETCCKDYGILSVVFQLYAHTKIHFKIPPTVFYPQPKVDSCLLSIHFLSPSKLKQRLAGVNPSHLRMVVNAAFQQRRKTVRNGLKKLALDRFGGNKELVQEFFEREPLELPEIVRMKRVEGDEFAMRQQLPSDWAGKRPEELSPGQFVEVTRLLFGDNDGDEEGLGKKVWRKLKHGAN